VGLEPTFYLRKKPLILGGKCLFFEEKPRFGVETPVMGRILAKSLLDAA
jgi:hypothetical protein